MRYTITIDGQVLYSEFINYNLIATRLSLRDNEIGHFSFTLEDSHPRFNDIVIKRSRIKIYRDGSLVWLGRVAGMSEVMDGLYSFDCEECTAYLLDSLMRPFDFNGSPELFLTEILNSHNNQVNADQRIGIGQCTVTDPNDYIDRSSINYLKHWDVLKDKLLTLGGHLVVSFNEDEEPILNVFKELETVSLQTIKFGQNLVDFERSLLYDKFCTAIVPLGAKSGEGEARLTIKSVNNDIDYLIDDTLAALYGVIYADPEDTTWDDVTVAANLKTKGQNWLTTKGTQYKKSITLTAEDISFMNADVGAFWFLQKVEFIPESLNSVYYLISDFDVDLLDPYSLNIVLSDEETDYVSSNISSATKRREDENARKIQEIVADYTTSGEARSITEETIQTSTVFEQKVNAIISSVLTEYSKTSDTETLRRSLFSQLTQLSDSFRIEFNSLSETVSGYGSEATRRINDIYSFIYAIAQTETQNGGVVIGESTSKIKLKLENDILYFFTGDAASVNVNNAIAYFAAGKLYVNNAQIQSLTLGIMGRYMDIRIIGEGDNVCAFFSGRLS